MPFGATPNCPCRKSKKPTPLTLIGTATVVKFRVGEYLASNCSRALPIMALKGLEGPTQCGAGISVIIVLPLPSVRIRWMSESSSSLYPVSSAETMNTVVSVGLMRLICGRSAGGARMRRLDTVVGVAVVRSTNAASSSVPVFTGQRSFPHAPFGSPASLTPATLLGLGLSRTVVEPELTPDAQAVSVAARASATTCLDRLLTPWG